MLYECAVTPDIFDISIINEQTMRNSLVQILRDISNKGTMADLCAGELTSCVRNLQLQTASQAIKDEIIICLNRLRDRNRLVRYPQARSTLPKNDIDWLMEIMHYHYDVHFHAIVLGKILLTTYLADHSPDPAFIEHTTALSSSIWQEVQNRTSASLLKSKIDYQKFLAPVLRHAKKLTLVDPYIRCDDRSERYSTFRTIEVCADLMRYASPGYIHIHTGEPCQRSKWKDNLQPLANKYKHHFTIFVCATQGRSRFHNRYILTDQCGIMSGDTLECTEDSRPSENVWSLLDKKTYDERFQELQRLRREKLCEVKPE